MANLDVISAAVYLFAKDEDGEWCILCGKRSGNNPRYSGGLMDVPCGLREFGEAPVENALRELGEETGVKVSPDEIKFIERQPWGNGNYGANFFGVLDSRREPIGGDWEHEYVRWLKVSEIENFQWAYGMDKKVVEYFNRYVKDVMTINEDILRKIIRTALLEAIDERGTNMQSLYHFTHLKCLKGILSGGKLNTSQWQEDKRNGKRFISFTRHKSKLEGFAMPRDCDVRIEVDGRGLSNARGSDTYPFEYYSPDRPWQKNWGITGRPSAKKMYQDARRERRTGEPDYMHQAEESFETKAEKLDIRDITKSIDILMPVNLQHFLAMASINEGGRIRDLYYIITDCMNTFSPLLDVTYVYFSDKDFNLQTENKITIKEFYNKILQVRLDARTQKYVAEEKQ